MLLPFEVSEEQNPLPDDSGFYGLSICVDSAMLNDLMSAVYWYTLLFETEADNRLYWAVLQSLSTEWSECE